MTRPLVALALLIALPAAQAPKDAATPLQRIATLPAEAAGWRRASVTDFEARPNGAGLGAAAEYRPSPGGPGVATLYLYDRSLPGGATAESLAAEFTQAVREVEMLGPMRRYRIESRQPGPVITLSSGAEAMRCEEFSLAFDGGSRSDSYLCLGLSRRAFVKLRVSLPSVVPAVEAQQLRMLGGELAAAIR
ncbi:hypothetical protein [Belnapia sp. F-4-1]|uniref:hypothetical protein n=1 Tax=Belnapia sp. F-4-1 TaxID=1545443 RepID=UPI0005BD1106|nr:hypothetical protein [Belnapia sp. F-4-1]